MLEKKGGKQFCSKVKVGLVQVTALTTVYVMNRSGDGEREELYG